MVVLKKYAKKKLNIKIINPWDLAYVSEKYKKKIMGFHKKSLSSTFQ